MPPANRTFYLYLGLHSLLIGMFPFYLPVFLWQQSLTMVGISLVIAVAGIGFNLGLWSWDRLRQHLTLGQIFSITALLLIALMLVVRHVSGVATVALLALCYGLYNGFFWTTQRAMFIEVTDPRRSGQAYGNLQLYVFALLQVGILIGGWLLERGSFDVLLFGCVAIVLAGTVALAHGKPIYPGGLQTLAAQRLSDVLAFRDAHRSRTMFLADGLFLFLESFYWVISLFLLARQSFTTLGIVVIVLAVMFGGLFYLLKNTIDRLGRRKIYVLAVALYAGSWLLRAVADDSLPLLLLFVLLVLVTFATSFFRLALNKRFYDLARQMPQPHRYLILKSYYSQFSIALCFAALALLAWLIADAQNVLRSAYCLAALTAPVFLLYAANLFRDE